MKPAIRFNAFSHKWVLQKLTDVVSLYSGLTYSPSDVCDAGTLVLRSSNVQGGEICLNENVFVNPNVANSPNVNIGDIIVVVRNGSRSLIGKHAQIKHEMTNTVIGAFMTGIRSNAPCFINSLLSTKRFDAEIEKNLGATINQITNGTFNSMRFFFPTKDEQFAIGNYFDIIDTKIQATSKKIESLKRLKSASLISMFPQDGESVPKVRFKEFQGEWEKIRLNEISYKVIEKNKSNKISITLTNSAEHGIIDQKDFFDHDISNSNNIDGYFVVNPKDFVYNPRISTSAPVGPINMNKLGYSGVMSPLYYVFRVNGINKYFLDIFFQTNLWHKFMKDNGNTGARFDRLSISDEVFGKMPIMYPSHIDEQQKIADFFTHLDKQITLQTQRLEKLKQIKSACLEKMFV